MILDSVFCDISAVGLEPKWKWTGRDLNPRLPPCEGGDHARLIYRPSHFLSEENMD